MDEFRQLANNGATVVVIHHTGKGEQTKKYRGSSDIQASIDAGWLLTAKKRLLKCLELSSWKFREGEVDTITFGFTDEGFQLIDPNFINEDNPHWMRIADVIKANPGLKGVDIAKHVPDISPATVNRALLWMDNKHKVFVQDGPGRSHLYFWAHDKTAHENNSQ
jgi:RecA-family ATPase